MREIYVLATGPSGGDNGGQGTRSNAGSGPVAAEEATTGRWMTSLDDFRLTDEDVQSGGGFGLANGDVVADSSILLGEGVDGDWASQCGGSG